MLNVALITLGDPTRLTGGYLYHLRVAELAPRHDARIRFVSLPDWRFPLPMLAAPSILQRVRNEDAVLLDSIAAAFLGPWLWLHPPGVPVLAMLHQPPGGIDHGRFRTAVQRRLDKMAYRHCTRLLVASPALAEEVRAAGFSSQRIRVVCPGRDVAEAAEDVPGDLRHNRKAAFLCVGNWVRRKDILTLIEAFATLPENAATLHLVGDECVEPDYASHIRGRLSQDDLRNRVVRHGKRTRGQVAGLYEAADAFVLASLKEPYGTVWGEAMASGLPVAGWRAGNLPYLADHEREGLFAEPGDVRGLAEAMHRLACDEPLRARLAAAARMRAKDFPTWDQTTKAIVDTVRSVLKKPTAECIDEVAGRSV